MLYRISFVVVGALLYNFVARLCVTTLRPEPTYDIRNIISSIKFVCPKQPILGVPLVVRMHGSCGSFGNNISVGKKFVREK